MVCQISYQARWAMRICQLTCRRKQLNWDGVVPKPLSSFLFPEKRSQTITHHSNNSVDTLDCVECPPKSSTDMLAASPEPLFTNLSPIEMKPSPIWNSVERKNGKRVRLSIPTCKALDCVVSVQLLEVGHQEEHFSIPTWWWCFDVGFGLHSPRWWLTDTCCWWRCFDKFFELTSLLSIVLGRQVSHPSIKVTEHRKQSSKLTPT